MMKPLGPYIAVKLTHNIISSGETVGVVIALGKTVNPECVKIGEYIRFNPNYGIKFLYKGEPFILLIDEHITLGYSHFTVIEDMESLLSDKSCGGDNIVSYDKNQRNN